MSRYTLKTFCGGKQIERFDHRNASKLSLLLSQSKNHCAGTTSQCGEPENNPDRFEIYDNQMEKIFNGTINDACAFARKLK